MQDNELEMIMSEIYTLREHVCELEGRLHTLEQDNEMLMRENQWLQENFPKEVANQLNMMYDDIWDLRNALKKHCNGFHSMLVLGGNKKHEDNIP